jgi:Holliday junction resolvase
MGAMQRRKGQSGERELFGLLRDELGVIVERNLSQTRNGGADSLSLPGLAIEVKRQEIDWSEAWWTQAVEQAGRTRVPVVAHRRSRQPWRFVLPLPWVIDRDAFDLRLRCTVGLREFCWLVRERMDG